MRLGPRDDARMRFGILASHQYPLGDDLGARLGELFDLVEMAADLDYDSVFTINHFVANLQTPQTISMTAAMIPRSGSMTIGTAVLLLPFFHPVQIAEEFATLDQLSGGRIVLGVGAGYRDDEFDAFGLDKKQRAGRLAESIEVIRKLWTGEPVDHEGRYFKIPGQRIGVTPLREGGPPIWIGAGGLKAIERAGRIGDGWLAPGNAPTAGWLDNANNVYADALHSSGRTRADVDRPIVVEMFCGQTDVEARTVAQRFVRDEYFTYSNYSQLEWQRSNFDFLWDEAFIIGSPETLIDRLNDLGRQGFDHVVFRPFWTGMPIEHAISSVELIAKEVMPHVRTGT